MKSETNFDSVWNQLYEKRQRPMKYPHDPVVIFLTRYLNGLPPDARPRVLDVGCGMGNNLWFAAREGCEVSGFDAAEKAIAYARRRFAEEGMHGDFRVGVFGDLPYGDGAFDVVLDSGGLTCAGRSVAAHTICEIRRVLAPGGLFYFNPLSTEDTSFTASEPGPDGTRINITAGEGQGIGHLAFYSRGDIESLLGEGWRLTAFDLRRREFHLQAPVTVRAMWHVVAEKVGS